MFTKTSPALLLPAGSRSAFGQIPGSDSHVDVMSHEMIKALGITLGFGGADRGFSTESDIVRTTTDGVDLAGTWSEFQAVLALHNANRQRVIDFLTYSVTDPVVTVPQAASSGDEFEIASEFGVPKSVRTSTGYFQMGFPFEWYDIAGRFTWKFLIEASAAQVESVHQAIMEADNRLVFGEVMRTLFNKANRTADINDRPYTVYGLYNADGTVPPPVKSTAFAGTHDHYMVSGAADITASDLDDLITNITEHGFDSASGASIVVMVNKVEAAIIRNFRNINNAGPTLPAGSIGTYDFIPSSNTPSLLMPRDMIVGNAQQPGGSLRGMKVIGAYGDAIIVEEDYIPAKYVVAFATGGSESLTNPLGIRQHANAGLRGLRLVKGRDADYPLQESYYQRGFGVGIRQRGSAAVMQIKASGSYEAPLAYRR